jgi:hypothetical protein
MLQSLFLEIEQKSSQLLLEFTSVTPYLHHHHSASRSRPKKLGVLSFRSDQAISQDDQAESGKSNSIIKTIGMPSIILPPEDS